jgi:predicted ATPase
MKLTKVLLRWYKSFNINYDVHASDRRAGAKDRPWNIWTLPDKTEANFPFIEIPIEQDITTVVGANESGKSHLLSAISKVINDCGIPGDPFSDKNEPPRYEQTDLCHFNGMSNKNFEVWPHIGLEFAFLSQVEFQSILDAVGNPGVSLQPASEIPAITLLLIPESEERYARLYIGTTNPIFLNKEMLKKVRDKLPSVEFINSQLPITNEVSLDDLLAAYGSAKHKNPSHYQLRAAQQAAQFIHGFEPQAGETITADQIKSVKNLKETLNKARIPADVRLELLLFRDVLGIQVQAVEKLYSLTDNNRSSAGAIISQWNQEIERTLNLSRYWQQDQAFSLTIDLKQGVLHFEIKDKTGETYTFRERSSGLRYFLSYYIQVRALERKRQNQNTIILMDEPDSFLSILGQRNLLSIFESFVSPELSKQNAQVIYTTHSPFLINRNFPRRIRLVRKGDAEEGTQFIEQARVRRFEPVRSALGIDLAQTLFMGATNVILEGPTDQYILAEAIRLFSSDEGMSDLLDLNSVIIVSAESNQGVEKLLAASRWLDEPIPTAVVLLDADEGASIRDRITGKNVKGEIVLAKKLIEPKFVFLISEVLSPFGKNNRIVTIEDMIPVGIYKLAIRNYIKHWCIIPENKLAPFESMLNDDTFSKDGLVVGTRKVFDEIINPSSQGYDKLGVMQEVVQLLSVGQGDVSDREQFKTNLLKLCQQLRVKIDLSDTEEKRRTGKQGVKRVIGEFFVKFKESATAFDIEQVLHRLESEAKSFGEDGKQLQIFLSDRFADIQKIRSKTQSRVKGTDWQKWKGFFEQMHKNPFAPGNVVNETPVIELKPDPSPTPEVIQK